MAKKKKGALIKLEGSGGVFYVAKAKVGVTLALRKYNKKLRCHEVFKEKKMK